MTATLAPETADLYERLILERARAPRHAGRLDPADAVAEGDNPMCGDRVHVSLRYAFGRIAALAHEAKGCAIMLASADLMAEAVQGADPAEAARLRDAFTAMLEGGPPAPGDLAALCGVAGYRSRHRCATLPWTALTQALEQTHG